MQHDDHKTSALDLTAWPMIGLLVALYMVSQFVRNSIGVLGPDLAVEYDLEAGALSLLSSIFFLAFALIQIPLGIAIDVYGPKRALIVTGCVMILGIGLFALAPNYHVLLLARVIMGLGCSSFLMAPLAIYARRFGPRHFASLTGIQIGGGNLGTLMATAPLALAMAHFGWRASFLVLDVVALGVLVLVIVFVSDRSADDMTSHQDQSKQSSESLTSLLRGVVAATRVPQFWGVFAMQASCYSAFAAILGLWGGPWLAQVYGLALEERGALLFSLSLAQMMGLFAWGFADRLFGSYKIPSVLGALLAMALLLWAAITSLSGSMIWAFFIAYGFVLGITPLLTAHGRSLFPPHLLGRGLTLLNIGSMGGVFAQQALTGFVISLYEPSVSDSLRIYPPEAYRAVFALIACEIGLAVLLYSFGKGVEVVKNSK